MEQSVTICFPEILCSLVIDELWKYFPEFQVEGIIRKRVFMRSAFFSQVALQQWEHNHQNWEAGVPIRI
jgi:hypothetical protein